MAKRSRGSSISEFEQPKSAGPKGSKKKMVVGDSDAMEIESEAKGETARKKVKKLKALELTSIGKLEDFQERSHWTSDLFMNSLEEPARSKTTERDLLVVTVYLPAGRSGKVGPGGRYNLTSREGISLFLTEECGIRNFGIMTMTMGIPTGARYMLDVTHTETSALHGLPKSIQRLAKDVGWDVTRLGDPQRTIKMAAKLPPWESVTLLVAALAREKWVELLENANRVRLCGGMVITEHVTFTVTPKLGVKLDRTTFGGDKEDGAAMTSNDLLTNAKWNVKVIAGGHTVLVTRMAGCLYCGCQDHMITECIKAISMAAERTPNFCFRRSDAGEDGKGKAKAARSPSPEPKKATAPGAAKAKGHKRKALKKVEKEGKPAASGSKD